MTKLDFSKVVGIDVMIGEDEEETEQFRSLYEKSKKYIETFRWHGEIKNVYFGLGVADIVGVFLFELIPASKTVDTWLWVVVGDIPPAYLVVDDAPNPASALDSYVAEMSKWVDAVNSGNSVDKCIPVNAAPSIENAADLEKRLRFIDTEILAYYKGDLNSVPPT
jgi:hypothetical protein